MSINPLHSDYPSPTGETLKPPHEANQSLGSKSVPSPLTLNKKTRDPVILSEDQRKHQNVIDAIKEVPDIRHDKVQKIQKALESGQYRIPSKDIADSIIQDAVINHNREPS